MINSSPFSSIGFESSDSWYKILSSHSNVSIPKEINTPKPSISFKFSYPNSQTNAFDQQSSSRKESDLFLTCRTQFKQIAYSEDLEYGIAAPTELLLKEFQRRFPNDFGAIIQDIYLKNVHDSAVMISLLKGISGFEYLSIYPMGQTAALAAVSNNDEQVREAGIRAFENWEHPDGIDILESVHTSLEWLDAYRISTIKFLRSL